MPSPFPGMDPYLEGYLWPDVHSALANKIRQQLALLLRPSYVARLDVYLVEDVTPEGDVGVLYPDVEILATPATNEPPRSSGMALTITPPSLQLPVVQPVPVRLTTVDIRDVANNRLVTSIEILSPVNKREPGLTQYRRKRQRLYQAAVHLLEIDLLRRGVRPFTQPRLPDAHYCIALTRAEAKQVDLWPIDLPTALPVVPVPLTAPDADVPLNLQGALEAVYTEAGYDLSLDYSQEPPPPSLSNDETTWVRAQLV